MDKPPRKRLVTTSSTSRGESTRPTGPYPILGVLTETGTPVTRENYLELSHPGQDPRQQMHPEAELELPPELRLGFGPE